MPAKRQRQGRSDHAASIQSGLIGYVVLIALLLLGVLAPTARLWGVNWWAFLSTPVLVGLVVLAVATPLILFRSLRRTESEAAVSPGRFLIFAGSFGMLMAAAWMLFPSATHFLGDGYQLLARLVDGVESKKAWDIGASSLTDVVHSVVPGAGEAKALSTYRIIAVGSGVVALVVTGFLALRLWPDTLRRVLFFLGLMTAGYALMWFGYVENYALLITMLLLYAGIGVLATRNQLSAWWALVPLIMASLLHIFGLALLPSFVYLVARDTSLARRLAALAPRTRWIIAGAIVVVGLAVYHYLNTTSYFFTFAFLPIIPDQFTVEGDWLFSIKHIVDTLNLLILLLPGLPIIAFVVATKRGRSLVSAPDRVFLLVMLLGTLATVYVFNPGIGMPRNWDLFSIVGVPLAFLGYLIALSNQSSGRMHLAAAGLMCWAGVLVLTPRVIAQATPEIGIAHFKNYLEFDRIRNRNARSLLITYYERTGDHAAAARELTAATQDFPELAHNNRGKELIVAGRLAEAEISFRRAIALNPLFYDAYGNLGVCLTERNAFDSALLLLEIADGLNPYNAETISNVGTVHLRQRAYESALDAFTEAYRIDSLNLNTLVGLASAHLQAGNPDQSITYVTRLYHLNEFTANYYLQAAEAYLMAGHTSNGRTAFRYALDRGVSTEDSTTLVERWPDLLLP